MFCLIYKSSANLALTQTEIQNILEQAIIFNRRNHITGCLLYYNFKFVQYLEGKETVINVLFEKIKNDQRHSKVQLLLSGHIYGREFSDWSMAYENLGVPNNRLEYLKLLMDAYFNNVNTFENLNPATKKFWITVKMLLERQKVEDYK